MQEDKIKKIIQIAKDSDVAELRVEDKDIKVTVKLQGEAAPIVYSGAAPQVSAPAALPVAASTTSTSNDSGLLEVTSPFVGTFYRSPSPEAASYVKVGDSIGSGQVLCIVEAMKIMNEIESEVSGEIVEICVENETFVEFGQVLFKVKA